MTITPRPRYTIRRGSRAALALAVTTGILCSSAPAAQAESLVGPAAFQNGVSSRAVDIDGLLSCNDTLGLTTRNGHSLTLRRAKYSPLFGTAVFIILLLSSDYTEMATSRWK